jgi:hypothetical protein
MSGGGNSSQPTQTAQPQMNWQTGQPMPQFATSSATPSPAQQWWTRDPGAIAAGGQEGLNANLRQGIQDRIGNMGNMFNAFNAHGVSQADVQNAIGANTDMYTYMNRPNYQQYSPNGQFNPTIYQSNYQNYNTGNPMAISQYGQGPNYYGAGLAQMMNTPFNPYTNSYQTPFSAPQAQPIVSRSASMRGTPNVVRRAEGGIASLMDNVE